MADETVELAATQVEVTLLKQEVAYLRVIVMALLEDRVNELGHLKGITGKCEKLKLAEIFEKEKQGAAWQGKARPGAERRGQARRGEARRGED